jgi:hypothetical protein
LPPSSLATGDVVPAREAEPGVRFTLGAARFALALLCAVFFWVQLDYCQRLPLVMDELQGAWDVYRLRRAVPYLDFMPYKTVLGYYLQLPFMLLERDLWSRMMAVKLGMAAVTALVVFACTSALARVIRAEAVVLATALLFAMSTFVERAAELRVDMLTSLAGLATFTLLLSRRYLWAGLACGLSFLISQKGIYYFVAGELALFGRGLFLPRAQWRWRDAWSFTAVSLGLVGVYIAVFGSFGGLEPVAHSVLIDPMRFALAEDHKDLQRFWMVSIKRNPYFYMLAVLGIGVALERARHARSELDWVIFAFAGTVLFLGVGHKQPWPYFFVLLLPSLLVPIARTIEQLTPRGAMFWGAYLLIGVIYPLYTRVPLVLARDSGHQRYTVELAERLLRKRETYLAGINMVYTREQSPNVLAWLDKASLDTLRRFSMNDLVAELQLRPPKLVIGNYRIDSLPIALRKSIRDDYDHLWASIWLYAPTIHAETFNLAYPGHYRLRADTPVEIDGQPIQPGTTVHLSPGPHTANATGFKLKYVPSKKLVDSLDMRYRMPADMFPAVHDY